jgi:hypothetical protein
MGRRSGGHRIDIGDAGTCLELTRGDASRFRSRSVEVRIGLLADAAIGRVDRGNIVDFRGASGR